MLFTLCATRHELFANRIRRNKVLPVAITFAINNFTVIAGNYRNKLVWVKVQFFNINFYIGMFWDSVSATVAVGSVDKTVMVDCLPFWRGRVRISTENNLSVQNNILFFSHSFQADSGVVSEIR